MTPSQKARENRLRRAAERQGYSLEKSRRRDPRALDFGLFWIVDLEKDAYVQDEGMTIDQVERFLR